MSNLVYMEEYLGKKHAYTPIIEKHEIKTGNTVLIIIVTLQNINKDIYIS